MFYKNGSIIRQLILLRLLAGGGTPATTLTVTGVSPLSLVNAIAHSMVSLTQYGKCVQDGVDILCNNGAIKYGKPLTLDSTRKSAYITDSGKWVFAADSYSIVIPVIVGKKYKFSFTTTDSTTVGVIFRYGFSNSDQYAEGSSSAEELSQWARTTPQALQSAELTADRPYLIVQMAASKAESNVTNGYFTAVLQEIYAVGTPETLTIECNEYDGGTPVGATLAYSVSDSEVRYNSSSKCVIIPVKPNTNYAIGFKSTPTSGSMFRVATVAERVSSINTPVTAIAADVDFNDYATKTINSGTNAAYMYIQFTGTAINDILPLLIVQEGTSIQPAQTVSDIPNLFSTLDGSVRDEVDFVSGVVTRRTEAVYEDGGIVVKALAEPVTEQTTPHSLHTAQGTNVVSVTAEVSDISLTAEYKGVAA